ncbi:MAG: hypothetical protein PHC49_10785 [Desulfuromonadaceae bacterium]|nr:hypothetical protein [Desulfuromonadaceae bacterium]
MGVFMRTANEILDEIRARKGLGSDTALGELFGVKQSTVGSWRARNTLPFADVIAFCDKEGISTDVLFIECKPNQKPVLSAEPAPIYLTEVSPERKKKMKLRNMLDRIIDEGDQKKIKAVEAQLDLLDPGEKKQSGTHENDGGGGYMGGSVA